MAHQEQPVVRSVDAMQQEIDELNESLRLWQRLFDTLRARYRSFNPTMAERVFTSGFRTTEFGRYYDREDEHQQSQVYVIFIIMTENEAVSQINGMHDEVADNSFPDLLRYPEPFSTLHLRAGAAILRLGPCHDRLETHMEKLEA